ncbi:hypothetical protein GCM10011490_15960 [Pseudoclavibacter endophyticus]|nr:hypothetical protein GCM10011490_15960 [Pseudoclavibacter endophyticus]
MVCCLVAVLAACSSRPAPLEDPPPVPTEEATFDTAAIEAGMDAMLAAGAPAVLVEVRDGDEVWRHALGVISVTGNERPDPLAAVRIASVTKSMIGVILLQLVAEGRLDLDEPIAEYLPDLTLGREVVELGEVDDGAGGQGDAAVPDATGASGPDLTLEPSPVPTGPDWTAPAPDPDASVPDEVPPGAVEGSDVAFDADGAPILDPTTIVTPRMLAQHTAGVPDYIGTFPLTDFAELPSTLGGDYDLDELIGRVAAEPWPSRPGGAFNYSNTNYLVLSLLIEQITGDPIERVIQERIAEGGGLEATSLPGDATLPEGGAHGYFELEGVYIDVSTQSASLWSGAGGIVSTVGDVNSFYRGLMQGAYVHADELRTALELNQAGYGIGVQGHADPCPPGDPVFATPPGPTNDDDADAGDAALDAVGPDGEGAQVGGGDSAGEDPTPSATPGDAGPAVSQFPQIGEPGMTYGHLGSGLGYRILSMSSPDGMRQVTLSWTASPVDYGGDPRLGPAWETIDAALTATCPRTDAGAGG